MSERENWVVKREERLKEFEKDIESSEIQESRHTLLKYLVNSDRCHFRISLKIFSSIVLLRMYTVRGKAVD